MANIRQRKVADSIKYGLSHVLLNVRDPNMGFVTVTNVRVTADLDLAYVYLSVVGTEKEAEQSITTLEKAKGFLRSSLAKNLSIRKTPDLKFFRDDSLDYFNSIGKLIGKIKSEKGNISSDGDFKNDA